MPMEQQIEQFISRDETNFASCFTPDVYFCPVPDDKNIVMEPFLKKAGCIVTILERCGSLFSPIRKDIGGNIRKLGEVLDEYPNRPVVTINDMLADKKNTGENGKTRLSVVWLTRALNFYRLFLQELIKDHNNAGTGFEEKEDISGLISKAYDNSLKAHHIMVMKAAFWAVAKMVPYRTKFLTTFLQRPDSIEDPGCICEAVLTDVEKYCYDGHLVNTIETFLQIIRERNLDY